MNLSCIGNDVRIVAWDEFASSYCRRGLMHVIKGLLLKISMLKCLICLMRNGHMTLLPKLPQGEFLITLCYLFRILEMDVWLCTSPSPLRGLLLVMKSAGLEYTPTCSCIKKWLVTPFGLASCLWNWAMVGNQEEERNQQSGMEAKSCPLAQQRIGSCVLFSSQGHGRCVFQRRHQYALYLYLFYPL